VGAYLILNGEPFAGACVLIWGLLVVTMATDYVIRPRLLGRKVGHPLLVLFALLGGIEVLGLPGLIVAPILMSFFLAVLRIYERETQGVSQTLVDLPRAEASKVAASSP
jgi:predicted PurR-regulated permease PerM